MALNKIDIPFNKDTATVGMAKFAIESIEQLMSMVERIENVPEDERADFLAGQLEQTYAAWVRKFPKKG